LVLEHATANYQGLRQAVARGNITPHLWCFNWH